MPLDRYEGIIIRARDHGEADRLLTLFSRERGKIYSMAKGARRPRSRFVGVQPFVHGSFALFSSGSGMSSLSQFQLHTPFRILRENLDLVIAASYVCEIVDQMTATADPNNEAFEVLLWALSALEETVTEQQGPASEKRNGISAILRFYEMKILQCLGYQPHLDSCVRCGVALDEGTAPGPAEDRVVFHPASGGLVCRSCTAILPNTVTLSVGAARLMKAVLDTGLRRLGIFKMTPAQGAEIGRALEGYIIAVTGHPINSRSLIKSLERREGLLT